MDTMTYLEKVASINDGSFGAKIAGDIARLANEKLAALPAGITSPQSIARWSQIFRQANPQQAAVISSRFRALGNTNLGKAISSTPVNIYKVTNTPVYSGQLQGAQAVSGYGPNRPQLRQQIYNREVGKQ